MSVYVGMDVHRKRSQIAVVGDAGTERRNRNVPNDPPSWCRSWAPSRRAPRSRSRPPTAGAGWSTYSANSSSNRTWSTQPLQGDRLGPLAGTTRSTRAPWPSCCAPTCYQRLGSLPSRSATSAPCWGIGHGLAAWSPRPRVACTRCWPTAASGRAAAVDDCGASLAGRPGPASRLACRHRRLRGAHRSAQPVGGPARAGPARPRRPRPLSRRAAGAARHRADHRHDAGRRDR